MKASLHKWISCVILLAASTLVLSGCMGSYGSMYRNMNWLEKSRAGTLPHDYTYYYTGRSTIPYAVVGIKPGWTFEPRFWVRIEPVSQVHDYVASLSRLHPNPDPKRSSDILSPSGEKIGIWFSHYPNSVVVVDEAAGKVSVYSPYKPNDDEGYGVR